MIHVYLDDYRHCPTGFVLAKNVEECKQLIDNESIDILSLDFDLGWGEPTGYEVVRHIVASGNYPKQIYLHTSSASGKVQMYDHLTANIPSDVLLHGGPMPQSILDEIADANKG